MPRRTSARTVRPAHGVDARGALRNRHRPQKEELAGEWHAAIRETYGVKAAPTKNVKALQPGIIGERTGSGSLNVGARAQPRRHADRVSVGTRPALDRSLSRRRDDRASPAEADFDRGGSALRESAVSAVGRGLGQGRQTARVARSGRTAVLAIVDAASGDITREIKFEAFGEIFQPTWSPDGHAIAFSAQIGGFTDLFIYDLNLSQTKRLTNDAFADLQPAWSPDGTRLAFVTDRFAGDLDDSGFGNYELAFITVADSAIAPIDTGLNGNASIRSGPATAAASSSSVNRTAAGTSGASISRRSATQQ